MARVRIPWGQLGVGIDDVERDLAAVSALSDDVPTFVVPATVFGDVCRFGVKRGVHRAVGEIAEERLGRIGCLGGADHVDRFVGQVVGEEIAVWVFVNIDRRVVADQAVRVVKVRESVEKPVVPIEPSLAWPRVARASVGDIGVFRQVPFADHQCGVSVGFECLGHRDGVGGEFHGVTRKPRIGVGHVTDAGEM